MPENAKKVRLDKFLTQAAELTRSEAKQKIKKGSVTVNEELIKKPEVKIEEILGHVNDPGVDIISIKRTNDLPTEFPEKVQNQA